jgi:hypothetical protein
MVGLETFSRLAASATVRRVARFSINTFFIG